MPAEAASFRISIDSMSFVLSPVISRRTPSTMMIGALDWLIDEPPRIRNTGSLPGWLLAVETRTPGTLPFSASPIELTGTPSRSAPLTFETALVSVRRDWVP